MTIRYMGSKRSLAPKIATLITQTHPKACVVDLFSGTCAVATALAPRHVVVANDIHAFGEIIATALLVAPAQAPNVRTAMRDLQKPMRSNLDALRPAISEDLVAEQDALQQLDKGSGWKTARDMMLAQMGGPWPRSLKSLPAIETYRSAPCTFPFALCSSTFAGGYFGIAQAATIDSIRYAIAASPSETQPYYLSALLHAASHCASSPGHFAQYLMPYDRRSTRYLARVRKRSIFGYFLDAIAHFRQPPCLDRERNAAWCEDACSVLLDPDRLAALGDIVLYADPPYSRAQYSRYYHVLETLVRYDYPEADGKGRYRRDRIATDFSRKGSVADAVCEFTIAAAEIGAPLYLSYPRNGLAYAAGCDMRELLSTWFPRVSIPLSEPLTHSTLGGAPGAASLQVIEDVFYARFP